MTRKPFNVVSRALLEYILAQQCLVHICGYKALKVLDFEHPPAAKAPGAA